MELKGKEYIEPTPAKPLAFPEAEVKAKIKNLVPETGKRSYKEIIEVILNGYIAQGKHFNSDDVLKCIKEIDAEWHPIINELRTVEE